LRSKPRFEIEIVGAGAVLEIEVDQADGRADALAALSSSSAVWIASVVTPAPPTAGMKV
jgi:hypothetical protein